MHTLFATEAAGVCKRSPRPFNQLTLNVSATSIGLVALPFSASARPSRFS
jgi:hypothetical protein